MMRLFTRQDNQENESDDETPIPNEEDSSYSTEEIQEALGFLAPYMAQEESLIISLLQGAAASITIGKTDEKFIAIATDYSGPCSSIHVIGKNQENECIFIWLCHADGTTDFECNIHGLRSALPHNLDGIHSYEIYYREDYLAAGINIPTLIENNIANHRDYQNININLHPIPTTEEKRGMILFKNGLIHYHDDLTGIYETIIYNENLPFEILSDHFPIARMNGIRDYLRKLYINDLKTFVDLDGQRKSCLPPFKVFNGIDQLLSLKDVILPHLLNPDDLDITVRNLERGLSPSPTQT